jgi:hypothetical protein
MEVKIMIQTNLSTESYLPLFLFADLTVAYPTLDNRLRLCAYCTQQFHLGGEK